MSRTVFVLGAGASAQCGAPLMSTFVSAAQTVSRAPSNQLAPEELAAFTLVDKARAQLQVVHSKALVNISNIESLFGTFEMAALLGKLGTLATDEVSRLPDAMALVIARTLEHTIHCPTTGHARNMESETFPRVLAPRPYDTFAQLVVDMVKHDPSSVSIVTFNYDLALDFALHLAQVPYTYRLGDAAGDPRIDLLKLHGSLNWCRCKKCNQTAPWALRDFLSKYSWGYALGEWAKLTVSDKLDRFTHCDGAYGAEKLPVIVPPTWNKGRFHAELAPVWKAAAKHLSQAENIVVIGYSLPATDEFFKYFYALGSVGGTILSQFLLVDPEQQVEERFRAILGPAARECFVPLRMRFGEAFSEMRQRLGVLADGATAWS